MSPLFFSGLEICMYELTYSCVHGGSRHTYFSWIGGEVEGWGRDGMDVVNR